MSNRTEIERIRHSWLSGNRENVEIFIIATAWWNVPFFQRIMGTLCRSDNPKMPWVDEFTNPSVYAVYRAIYDYNVMWLAQHKGDGLPFVPATARNILDLLTNYAAEGEVLTDMEIPMAVNKWHEAAVAAQSVNLDFLTSVFPMWMKTRKTHLLVSGASARQDYEGVASKLMQIEATMRTDKRVRSFTLAQAVQDKTPDVKRLPTDFPGMDIALGGGIGVKEGTLIIAGTGAGKTVCACQIASCMSMAGSRGGIITTEQDPKQLSARIVACHARVNFDAIKDGVEGKVSTFMPDQLMNYEKAMARLGEKTFRMRNWETVKESENAAQIDAIVDEWGSEMGGLDYLVFDWLGKKLIGNIASTDGEAIRLSMKNAANALLEQAEKHKISVVVMAQGHPTRCRNNPRVDSSCLTECLTIGENFTNIIGISSMMAKETEESILKEVESYRTNQPLYFSKSRKSVGGRRLISRQFEYQRFGPYDKSKDERERQ